jgi:hypothetical protein
MQPKTWVRLIAEAVAIVFSILAAFGIDAWWDARQLREQEAIALRSLRIEFTQNMRVLEAAVEHHQRSIEAGERLLAMGSRTEPLAARPTLDSMIMAASIDFVTYESNSSTLNDLLASGRLGLIRDDTLRAALAIWPTAVSDVVEDQLLVARFVESALLPYLSPRIATAALYNNAAHAGFGSFAAPRDQGDLAGLVAEREFQSHLANRVAHERQVLNELEGYLRPVGRLIVGQLDPSR